MNTAAVACNGRGVPMPEHAESVAACECGESAEVLLTMLDSTSLDAVQTCCLPCVVMVLEDWSDGADVWGDTPGWTVERLTQPALIDGSRLGMEGEGATPDPAGKGPGEGSIPSGGRTALPPSEAVHNDGQVAP